MFWLRWICADVVWGRLGSLSGAKALVSDKRLRGGGFWVGFGGGFGWRGCWLAPTGPVVPGR